MNAEIKACQNCKKQFAIEQDDFAFYEKIKVPPPTWCTECRRERLLTWRNERTLYRRKCAATNKDIISVFRPDSPMTIYDRDYWWSDSWNPEDFGREYDFSKPFFSQFRSLMEKAPMPAVFNSQCLNSEYCNHITKSKNCYLVFATWHSENLMYSAQCSDTTDSLDILTGTECELCYDDIKGIKLYRVFYSDNCEGCSDCAFLYDCKGCQYCFGCTNLRNKSYYFFNKSLGKEAYLEKMKEFNLGNREGVRRAKQRFETEKLRAIRRPAFLVNSTNSTGDYLERCESCVHCFGIRAGAKNCKNCYNGGYNLFDSRDSYGPGVNAELLYESIDTGVEGSSLYFDIVVYGGMNVEYSYNCHGASNCFGCVGLRNKQYCILNKQYSKDAYEILITKIKQHMSDVPYIDKKGRKYSYGEFFPVELSPFAFNETISYEFFPYSRGELRSRGYEYLEPAKTSYKVTVDVGNVPVDLRDVDKKVTDEVIACEHAGTCRDNCSGAFRITPQELQLYEKLHICLPVLCPNCRHMERVRRTNPFFLWHRVCQCSGGSAPHFHGTNRCPNEFETSYAPDRSEIVYCEQCYQAEVA